MKKYNVAIVGATGAVGEKLIQLLEDSSIAINELHLLASARSAGRKLIFNSQEVTVEETTESAFKGIDIAFFSAGGSITQKFHQAARDSGAIVIDNTSAFRMDPNTPLVVPEVNPEALRDHTYLIANPNCSTIQMVAALKPIEAAFGLDRVIVSTYQAVSGAGLHALEELEEQTKAVLAGEEPKANILPSGGDKKHYPIAFNAIPQIDLFSEDGYTFEEWKMMNETKKIMGLPNLKIAATCVRIPVMSGHSESVYIEVEKDGVTADEIREVLKDAPGIVLQDDPSTQTYPMVITAVDKKDTYVGRIRRDVDNPKGFHLWIVSDNLIKGAAWNSIQIAEKMIEMALV
ncbi:aspartate-semialdehyde dehydrogenase [Jeotgalibaca sp. A122]|uniref:aspartate-semialdehyde dehydrogenase n=1 Tax=Jeotgalibaca sp. A122 TaxID=3457322 RepID=UPI003FD18A18